MYMYNVCVCDEEKVVLIQLIQLYMYINKDGYIFLHEMLMIHVHVHLFCSLLCSHV